MSRKLTTTAARVARTVTGRLVFRKRLPKSFGGARIHVTSRADIRLLTAGWDAAAGDLLRVVDTYVRPGMCVWDFGSNLGILSFIAASRVGPQGKVFTVEADPKYAELQNRTVRNLPDGYGAVVPLCAAVSDAPSLLTLTVPKNGHARNHLSTVEGNTAGAAECEKAVVSVTADFLRASWPAPDFLKIDVEGAELLVLEGARRLLHEDRPVMYIEVSQKNSEAATRMLREAGYSLYALDESGVERRIERCEFNTVAKPD